MDEGLAGSPLGMMGDTSIGPELSGSELTCSSETLYRRFKCYPQIGSFNYTMVIVKMLNYLCFISMLCFTFNLSDKIW